MCLFHYFMRKTLVVAVSSRLALEIARSALRGDDARERFGSYVQVVEFLLVTYEPTTWSPKPSGKYCHAVRGMVPKPPIMGRRYTKRYSDGRICTWSLSGRRYSSKVSLTQSTTTWTFFRTWIVKSLYFNWRNMRASYVSWMVYKLQDPHHRPKEAREAADVETKKSQLWSWGQIKEYPTGTELRAVAHWTAGSSMTTQSTAEYVLSKSILWRLVYLQRTIWKL